MKRMARGAWVGWVLVAGCGGDDPSVDPAAPTYHADVAPLVERECSSCHAAGGIGPFALETYEQVVDQASAVVSVVQSGYMPPWMPDRSCGDIANERGLSAEERRVFVDWNAGGQREGDPADAPPPPERPTVVLSPTDSARVPGGGYVPDVSRADDYRCFLLDIAIDETRYLTGSWVQPDESELVHHVLVYAVPAARVAEVEAASGADGQVGYTCFGGPLPGVGEPSVPPTQLGAWVPGLLPDVLAEGRGIRIESGSRLVMQVHYDTHGSFAPEADETEFQMRLEREAPAVLVETLPLPILELEIAAGDPDAVETRVFRNWTAAPMTLVALTPHMHLLGRRFSARLLPAAEAGGEDQCLLEIPDWDFHWQQGYARPGDNPVVVQPGEGIEVTCAYDNSAVNQPVVDGMQREPVDVGWGEGTLDEMCLLYVRREVPFAEASGEVGRCSTLGACRAECGDGLGCLYACEALNTVDRECQNCVTRQAVACVTALNEGVPPTELNPDHCGTEWFFVGDCMRECLFDTNILGGSTEGCLVDRCGSAYQRMVSCTDALVRSGDCADYLGECDGSFAPGG